MMVTAPFPELRRDIVAILRGVRPDEIEAIGVAIFDAGIEAIEVPLNSPDPFASISTLVRVLPARALVGAGTVLTPQDADRLSDVGGKLLVSPNIDRAVMARAAHHKLVTMPGVFTPTEAFQALAAGASALKFFPAGALGVSGIGAIRAVLPSGTRIGAVGGVSDKDFTDYAKIGVRIFGLGSSLYAPGMDVAQVKARATAAVDKWDAVFGSAE